MAYMLMKYVQDALVKSNSVPIYSYTMENIVYGNGS